MSCLFFCLPTTHTQVHRNTTVLCPIPPCPGPVTLLRESLESSSSTLSLKISVSSTRLLATLSVSLCLKPLGSHQPVGTNQPKKENLAKVAPKPLRYVGRYSKKSSYRDSLLDNLEGGMVIVV